MNFFCNDLRQASVNLAVLKQNLDKLAARAATSHLRCEFW